MPELPEVQTTVNILNKEIKGLRILDVWTDYDSPFNKGKENIKDKKYFTYFRKQIIGQKILGVRRRAKNVLINVSHGKTILTHMKMTGHFLYGKYFNKNEKWFPEEDGGLKDPFNRFVHLVFTLSNKKHFVLSDMRKFAKVFVFDAKKLDEVKDLNMLGPEPLDKSFTYKVFKKVINKKLSKKIKTVLLDQEIIAGIGNIYSDEVLWLSSIHPLEKVSNIKETKLKLLYKNIIKVLKESISIGGDSMSDYRNPYGEKGEYQKIHKVYRKIGEKCTMKNCAGIIQRIKVGGRSAHFCPEHQKLGAK